MSEAIGFIAMLVLGLVLGTLGAGGSILTVPILVYLFGVPAVQATGYSLMIVGTTACVGAAAYLRRRQIHLPMAAFFGLPTIIGVYISRRVLVPAIPDPAFHLGAMAVGKNKAILLFFAVIMLASAVAMLRTGEVSEEMVAGPTVFNYPVLLGLGLVVGLVTGIVGAGGGFLVLPVLVLLGRLPVKLAIGTSLLIISAKSLLGFIGEVQVAPGIDWSFILLITLLPIAGVAVGTMLNRRIPAAQLRPAFGWFIFLMGVYMIGREVVGL